MDRRSVAGQMQSISQPALILPTFAGVGPIKIYSFVSAINLQMRLNILYNPLYKDCQVVYKNKNKQKGNNDYKKTNT